VGCLISEEFQGTDEYFQGTNENDGEIPSSGNFKSSEDDYDNGGHFFPSGEFKDNNVGDYEFPPSDNFQSSNEDDEEYLSSGDFQSSEDY
jgi:hypothetical protein